MRSCEPASSWLTVVPSAVVGSLVSRKPSAPSKCTSPPKARVTALPLPFHAGFRGELLRERFVRRRVVVFGGRGGLGASAGEEGKVDEEGDQDGADGCKLATPASDPARDHVGTMSHDHRAGSGEGQHGVPPRGQGGDEPTATAGDHGQAVVEPGVVAVIGVRHVGGRRRRRGRTERGGARAGTGRPPGCAASAGAGGRGPPRGRSRPGPSSSIWWAMCG